MTGSADCRDIRHALGVYVLGAIDPAERAIVDTHLSTCPECREELAGLAGLPALLRRVPVGEAQQLAGDDLDELPGSAVPSDEMLRSLLARTTQTRQTRRWRGLAAAAAVVVVAGAAGAAGVSALNHGGGPGSPPVPAHFTSVSATNPVTRVAATVRYAPRTWGTVLDTRVKNVPAGAAASSWSPTRAGTAPWSGAGPPAMRRATCGTRLVPGGPGQCAQLRDRLAGQGPGESHGRQGVTGNGAGRGRAVEAVIGGLIACLAVLAGATAFGVARRRRDGRLASPRAAGGESGSAQPSWASPSAPGPPCCSFPRVLCSVPGHPPGPGRSGQRR